jgi:hypothetical protein
LRKIGKPLEGTGIGNTFPSRTSITQEIRARVNKWDCIEFQGFWMAKETTFRIQRQPTEWEKTFSIYVIHRIKRLIFRIYKELQKE